VSPGESPEPRPASRAPGVALAVLLVSSIAAGLAFFPDLRTPASAWFVLVCWAVLYAPGRMLLDAMGVEQRGLDSWLAAVLAGVLAAAGLYWVFASLGVRGLFWAWPLAGALSSLRRLRDGGGHRADALRWSHVGLAVVVVLAALPLGIVPILLGNLTELPDGGLSFQPLPDVVFHAGVARELQHAVPPQVPFLPGVPLRYHYGGDLLVALLGAVPGLELNDVLVRFTPLLFVTLAAVAAFCFGRAFLGSEPPALLFALLVFFGEDLSWIPGWWTGSREAWAVQFFGVPSTVSLYLLNPMLPALAFLLAGLAGVMRFASAEAPALGRGVLTAVLFAGALAFKVFAGAQVFASLGLAAVLHLALRRDRRPLLLLLGTGALALPLALPLLSAGSGRMWVRLEAWPWVPVAIARSSLFETAVGRAAVAGFEGAGGWWPAVAYGAIALPLYLLGALGLRWLGLPQGLAELLRARECRPGQLTTALFVAIGPALALAWSVTPAGYPPFQTYNESVWFFTQSKCLAWIFAVAALQQLLKGRRRWLQVAGMSLFLGGALPSGLQYLAFQAWNASELSLTADQVAGLRELQRRSRPGDVVLAEGPLAGAAVALTHCRARELSIFAWVHVPPEQFERERQEEHAFWEAWRAGRLREDLAVRVSARFVLTQSGSGPGSLEAVAVHGPVRLFELGAPRERRP